MHTGIDYNIDYIRDAILSQLAIDCQTRHEVLERFIGRVMLTDLKHLSRECLRLQLE